MNILHYDSAQKKQEWADKFKRCYQLQESLGYCTEKNRWLRILKQQTQDESLTLYTQCSVHSKSLSWKLEFTWEKGILDALPSAAVKKANVTVGFINQGISSEYINSIHTNIFKSPHPRPKTVLTGHTWKKINSQNTNVMKNLLQKEQRKKALLITRSRTGYLQPKVGHCFEELLVRILAQRQVGTNQTAINWDQK